VLDDVIVAREKDPSSRGGRGVEVLVHPGVRALWAYRLAHRPHERGVPLPPRLISRLAGVLTGTDGNRLDQRHPALGDRVVVGTGASVLGPATAGRDPVVGAHAPVLRDVPARLIGKLEPHNPGGSVKDRTALATTFEDR